MKIYILLILIILISGCLNPFAPKLVEEATPKGIITDQKTIEGVFQNFRYSYIFKDTSVYSRLLDENFVFVFRNYDIGVDVTWGKEEDLRTTFGLFQATSNIDLIWSDSYFSFGDSTEQIVQRGFSLTLNFSPSDVVRLQGKANFKLIFDTKDSIWKINYWRDETYF